MTKNKVYKKCEEMINELVSIANKELDHSDAEFYTKALKEMIKRALDSYQDNFEDIRFCSKCGLPLTYESISYYEGYHVDSCY